MEIIQGKKGPKSEQLDHISRNIDLGHERKRKKKTRTTESGMSSRSPINPFGGWVMVEVCFSSSQASVAKIVGSRAIGSNSLISCVPLCQLLNHSVLLSP